VAALELEGERRVHMKFGCVLVLGAHPDDEMGCGGLIGKMIEEGSEVHHYYFSDCAKSTQSRGFDPMQLIKECEASRDVLGIPADARGNFDFPVRDFPAYRQEILEELVQLNRRIRPDLVLTTNVMDIHQDHKTLTEEAIRAFKNTCMLGYELPWNNLEFAGGFYVRLSRRQLEVKVASIQCYATQRESTYVQKQNIEAIARFRGLQAGSEFAECYQAIRIIA
jgi:N-acetylglucosamine malate deacetylase 1